MSHIKNNHQKVSPDILTKENGELKWTWSKNAWWIDLKWYCFTKYDAV